jgi:hypothetical protein
MTGNPGQSRISDWMMPPSRVLWQLKPRAPLRARATRTALRSFRKEGQLPGRPGSLTMPRLAIVPLEAGNIDCTHNRWSEVNRMNRTLLAAAAVLILAIAGAAAATGSASATHSWGGYHWARTGNPFTLKLGNNTSGTWSTDLTRTVSPDWKSAVLDTSVVAGGTRPKTCRPTSGRVEVCSANYGNTGWLGVAQIWVTGGVHITQGTVKNNDYYFGSSTYQFNNEAEKLHVICQEVGHTLGLDHQSTDGTSLNTCMDYYHNTSASDTKSTHPNQHDYDELGIIYGHLDSTTTVGASRAAAAGAALDEPDEWGKLVSSSKEGHSATFERDFGGGNKVVTFVIFTQ